MNGFGLLVGLMLVVLAVKPSAIKAQRSVRKVRAGIRDLSRRRLALSQQLRTLARECRNQRMLTTADTAQVQTQAATLATLEGELDRLQSVDRRIIVMDERRGPSETGWIACIRRDGPPPLGEPPLITRQWRDGRYHHCFAADGSRARRKIGQRLPTESGYVIVGEILPHPDDLTTIAKLPDAVSQRALTPGEAAQGSPDAAVAQGG